MDKKTNIIQYGLGPIGLMITKDLLENTTYRIVGAIDSDPEKIGKDVALLAGLPEPVGITISNDKKDIFEKTEADIVILTTTSTMESVFPQIEEIVSNKINIVSTCEELSYPWKKNYELSKKLDTLAKENNVTVLGTGINPGYLMDTLAIVMTGICNKVEKVTVNRIQDAGFRRKPFQDKVGAGLTVQEFDNKVKAGLFGHAGLKESMHMLASKIGWALNKTEEHIEPVVAEEAYSRAGLEIEAGKVLGINQYSSGFVNSKEVIRLVFKASVGEDNPHDNIIIQGKPEVNMKIRNGINGDIGTSSVVINSIPGVISSKPGLITMADLIGIYYSMR